MKIETWPIEKLIPYARNPRKNDHAVQALAGAIREFGFRVPILAKSDGSVVDGHLRLKAALALGMTEVPVINCDDMTEAQVKAFRISVNRMAELAEWDFELLSLELGELKDMDVDLEPVTAGLELPEVNDTPDVVPEVSDKYTHKVQIPIYEPHGDCPSISELLDESKVKELENRIATAGIPDEIKTFLVIAAQRHRRFNYSLIAEYYAHAPAEIQKLFEESALVLIDFNAAIEGGFVKITDQLSQLVGVEVEANQDGDDDE